MYIFFLIINFIFSTVFYFFWKYVETIFFIIIWLLMFFYFSPLYFGKKLEKPSILSKIKISKETLKKTIPLFQKISYLIAFFFFYLSLYWISYSYWWNLFPYFTLILSLLIFLIFIIFINKQKPVINLIFRSNFLIFSVIGIILFINRLVYLSPISYIYIINSSLSLLGIITIIIFDKFIEIQKKNTFYLYFLTYFLIYIIFYIEYYFKLEYGLFLAYLWFIISIFYFEIITQIKYFKKFDAISKYYGLFLNYIVFIFSALLLFIYPNYLHFVLLLFWWIIFHYFVHFRFKNYISLSIILISIILIYIKNIIPINPNDFFIYILFIYILPFIYIGYTYIFENKYVYDNYFISFSAILFSLFSIIVYFSLSWDFNILHISIIFLLQSFLLFSSFVKLKVK